MSTPYVTIERNGPVAIVRFDRKKNLNAFDGQLIIELTEAARSFHDDLETRAVVLTGAKDYFSAGADLEDLSSRNDPTISDLERRQTFYRGGRLCDAWETMPQITVAATARIRIGTRFDMLPVYGVRGPRVKGRTRGDVTTPTGSSPRGCLARDLRRAESERPHQKT